MSINVLTSNETTSTFIMQSKKTKKKEKHRYSEHFKLNELIKIYRKLHIQFFSNAYSIFTKIYYNSIKHVPIYL